MCTELVLLEVVVSCGAFREKKSKAKKTPLGERGIRVIVVVANSVSVSAY